jgi:hypothetical protein
MTLSGPSPRPGCCGGRLDDVAPRDASLASRMAGKDEAEAIGFTGSPASLAAGRDSFADSALVPGLACREPLENEGGLADVPEAEDEAMRTLAWLEGMGQSYAEELQSFGASGADADPRNGLITPAGITVWVPRGVAASRAGQPRRPRPG